MKNEVLFYFVKLHGAERADISNKYLNFLHSEEDCKVFVQRVPGLSKPQPAEWQRVAVTNTTQHRNVNLHKMCEIL